MQQDLAARYHQALGRLVAAWPAAFAGTDLDPETTRKRMEKLVAQGRGARVGAAGAAGELSPTELLAQQLRERLAANTMAGGETRGRERGVALARRRAGSAQRAGAVDAPRAGAAEVAGPLNERFQRACRRFFDQRRRASRRSKSSTCPVVLEV